MIGHENLEKIFKKLADSQKLSQNYLFYGDRMIGKKSFALSLANYLENKNFKEPTKNLNDTLLIDAENSSLGIDIVTNIKEFLYQKPIFSPYRVLIINNAENFTSEAQNAMLKITEDSPDSALIIAITADLESLISTFSSRFIKIYFNRLTTKSIFEFLKSNQLASEKDAYLISKMSFGKIGLAINLALDKNYLNSANNLKSYKNNIKELIAKDNFNLNYFLEKLIIYLSTDVKKNYSLLKKVLFLKKMSRFNLNPRLQLENLLSNQ